ncbi:MAG: zf-HC2 domain-containing protein [Phycisphaerales bacterium]|nr:zf-HC2 domain-containing protein [Phycisphaerales bacterium]
MISARFDGELPESGLRRLEEHLQGCASCRAAEADLHRLGGRLSGLPVAGAGDEFARRVMDGLGEPSRRRVGSRIWLDIMRPAAGIAAALAFASGVLLAVLAESGSTGPAADGASGSEPVVTLAATPAEWTVPQTDVATESQLLVLWTGSSDAATEGR